MSDRLVFSLSVRPCGAHRQAFSVAGRELGMSQPNGIAGSVAALERKVRRWRLLTRFDAGW